MELLRLGFEKLIPSVMGRHSSPQSLVDRSEVSQHAAGGGTVTYDERRHLRIVHGPSPCTRKPNMSTEPNPFADRDHYPMRPKTRNPLVIVATVLGIAFVGLLFLVGTVALTAYRHVRPSPTVSLSPRSHDLRTEFRQFEDSVGAAFHGAVSDEHAEIENMLCDAFEKSRAGRSVTFNLPMFIESVMQSPYADGIDLREQFLLRKSLTVYPPEVIASDYERVLTIHTDTQNPKLARADLFLYTSEDQAVSTRVYLVRSRRGWEVYDILKLEDGLRVSDEYASYFAAQDRSNFEESAAVIELIEEATVQLGEGETETAMATLRRAETISVEPASMTFAKLRIAYCWMSMNEYAEAQRVLLTINDPERCWGVWPNLAICCTYLDDYEQAKKYADLAAAQCERHPNVESIFSTCYAAMGRSEDAADAMANALRLLPADEYFFSNVSDNARMKDLSLLLESLDKNPRAIDSRWLTLVAQCESNSQWGALLLNHVESNTVPDGIGELIQGHLAERDGNLDAAARWSLKAMRSSNSDEIRRSARHEHMERRLLENNVPQLFAESLNARETALDLFSEADYGFSGDHEQAARAVQTEKRLANFPIRLALAGYLYYLADNYAKAAPLLEEFHANNRTRSEEERWIDDVADTALAELWLDAGELRKYLAQWESDEARMVQAFSYLRGDAWGTLAETFLGQPAGNPMTELIGDVLRAERDIRGSHSDAYEYGDFNPSRQEAVGRYNQAIRKARSTFSRQHEVCESLTASLTRLVVQTGLPAESVRVEVDLQERMLDVALSVATEFSDGAQMAEWAKQIDFIPQEQLSVRGLRGLRMLGE
ncbi:MAG: tetratricopeptide repeat protein, partial [Planctomycetota bacterium]